MANVIAVVQDDRVRRQIEQFVSELGIEDLRFATFKYVQEFQNLYFRDRSKDPPPEEGAEEKDGAELKLFSEIHMIIFAIDSIGEKSSPWLDKTKTNLRQYKYWPATGTRMVMIKFEDDGLSKLDVLHPLLDDLIYLPLDRLVFLQKMQILIHLPKRVSPKYLFNQEVKHQIEISKLTKIDRLSDVALAIRNPVPLKKGLPGHFYITFPGEKTRLEIVAKVIRSEPHPEYPGQFLIYFAYFGLAKQSLTEIRRMLSKAPRYQSLLVDDREKFRHLSDGLFDDHTPTDKLGVVVIDSDEIAGTALSLALAKDMDRLHVTFENSFQLFLHRHFEKDPMAGSTPPKATDESDFYKCPISLSVATSGLKLLSVDPGPDADSKICGLLATEIFSTPEKWLDLLDSKESRLIMEEAVGLVAQGRVLEKLLTIKDAAGARRALNFKIYRGSSDQIVTIELRPASMSDILARMNATEKETSLNAIVIESGFVPEDPTGWMEGIRGRAMSAGLLKDPQQLKFFFLAGEGDTRSTAQWLASKDVAGLFPRPVDNRQLIFLMSEFLANKATVYNFDNLGWSSPQLTVHVSKEVNLEAISEFGATIRSPQKLVPGTMIYLRKSIFVNAPNQCLAARVYSCEEHPNEKGSYQVFATYFGINDAFLKFARTWIRENYAHQKSGSD